MDFARQEVVVKARMKAATFALLEATKLRWMSTFERPGWGIGLWTS